MFNAHAVSRYFAVLRPLQQIRRSVPTYTFKTLVSNLVLTRLDYGNSVLAAWSSSPPGPSTLNAAARLTYNLRRSDHITDALVCLQWLRACRSESITSSLFWCTKSCTDSRRHTLLRSTTSPTYLAADRFVLLAQNNRLAVPHRQVYDRRQQGFFRLSARGSGTICQIA